MHARRELDKNLCNYACKVVPLVFFSVLIMAIIPLIIALQVPRSRRPMSPALGHSSDGAFGSATEGFPSSDSEGTKMNTHREFDKNLWIYIPLMIFLVLIPWFIVFQTGCLFYDP